jgi:hypothetical protein
MTLPNRKEDDMRYENFFWWLLKAGIKLMIFIIIFRITVAEIQRIEIISIKQCECQTIEKGG